MIVPLTDKIYRQFYGKAPPFTVKGLASVDGEECFAICVVAGIMGRQFIAFDVKPGFSKRELIKGWKSFRRVLSEYKVYYAIKDSCLETAEGVLSHFGFTHLEGDIYIYRAE